jgi:hypothetical protein
MKSSVAEKARVPTMAENSLRATTQILFMIDRFIVP